MKIVFRKQEHGWDVEANELKRKEKGMLTEREKEAAKKSRYFGDLWGEIGKGLWPAAKVAQLRGVKFYLSRSAQETSFVTDDNGKAHIALVDVAQWLGLTKDDYLNLISREGKHIFRRADNAKV